MPSQGECDLGALLRREYNHYRVFTQWPLKVGRTTLFLDFYIPQLRLAFEVDGRQHEEFVRHFHGTREGFEHSLNRDSLKADWCLSQKIKLIRFNSREKVDARTLRSKILNAATAQNT